MSEWFWSLHGAELLGIVIGGIVSMLAAIGGIVVWLSRWIVQGTAHDLAVCNCYDCRDRRVRRAAKTEGRLETEAVFEAGMRTASGWMTTRELYRGVIVGASRSRSIYKVVDIKREHYAWLVSLEKVGTKRPSLVTISTRNLDKRIWQHIGKS